ncbi:MAG: hypothetical protein FWG10_11285, partial [Eubacteriaceae bacterium]|nr:hypothetical protein [Eubacteriaceae bacterium]
MAITDGHFGDISFSYFEDDVAIKVTIAQDCEESLGAFKRLFNMSINVDKWYNNAKKAVYHYMRNKYPSDITRDQ